MIATRNGFVSGGLAGRDDSVEFYKGIPFAASTAGQRRWRAPEPPESWSGVRPCLEFGPACPQPRASLWPLRGPFGEDCLSLNVWKPAGTPESPLPIMVWFHGGGFSTGTGGSLLYDGTALARRGVVVVTFNYRLGPFGFLAHPSLSAESPRGTSGNYGLLDGISALKWARDNGAAFGGDPGCVTIFGESAGASSVLRLAVSPLARGLFHRVIAQSGTVWGRSRPLRGAGSMEEAGSAIADRLGCRGEDPAALLECLRGKDADEILEASSPAQGLFSPGTRFGPIVDGHVLPGDPELLFEAASGPVVPFLLGTNADEGSLFVTETGVADREGYAAFLRRRFGSSAGDVAALYPVNSDAGVIPAMNRLITDGWFVAPARALARVLSATGRPVHLYYFTRVSPAARKKGLGAFHASEVSYVFDRTGNTLAYDDADRNLSRLMSDAWVRFARTGTPGGSDLPAWPAYEAGSDGHLEFGDQVRTGAGLRGDACDLFDRIHEESPPGTGPMYA